MAGGGEGGGSPQFFCSDYSNSRVPLPELFKIKMAKNNFGNLAPFISKIKITNQETENSDYRKFVIQTPEQLILKALCNLDSLKI